MAISSVRREGVRAESALFGIAGHRDAARITRLGLAELEYRGGLGAGMVVSDGASLRSHRGVGSVAGLFSDDVVGRLRGTIAVGRVGGGVADGGEIPEGVGDQPLIARDRGGRVAVALAGRLLLRDQLRDRLVQAGSPIFTVGDAEILVHYLARSDRRTFVNRLVDAVLEVQHGGFAVLVCEEDRLVAVRDPHGVRTLLLGRLDGATVVCTDDSPLRALGADVIREVEPGEMLIAGADGATSVRPFPRRPRRACLQEVVSIARNDVHAYGQASWSARVAFGQRLGRVHPCRGAEVVVGTPGAGVPIAIGFARAGHLPYEEGLIDVAGGRRVVPGAVDGHSVALVVPTLASGDGVTDAVALLKRGGATEVHLRVASPALVDSCSLGVDTPTHEELASHRHAAETALMHALGVKSVGMLGIDDLHALVGAAGDATWCDQCFTGNVAIEAPADDEQLPLF